MEIAPRTVGAYGIRGHARKADESSVSAVETAFIDGLFAHNFNQRLAAESANLNKSTGEKMLQRPRVQDEIDRRREIIAEEFDLKAADVIREMSQLAFFNIADYMDEKGNIRLEDVPRDKMGALVGLEVIEKLDRNGEVAARHYKIKSAKMEALDRLMKHLNLLGQAGPANLTVNGAGGPIQISWENGDRVDVGPDVIDAEAVPDA